jgi:two-component system LytT family response regulator
MKLLRAILVDDERIGRLRLRRMLEREADVEVIAECADGPSTIQAVQEHRPDLLFLDIQMPGMDGFEVLDTLHAEHNGLGVIFVTAFDEHAVRAFEACALDYLLKPVSPERLSKAIARARSRIMADRQAAAARTSAAESLPIAREAVEAGSHRFTVRSGGRVSIVPAAEIDWIEAAGNYAILHAGALNHMIRETMSALEARLPAEIFLRVSRSAIVNLRRVKELHAISASDAEAVLATGARVAMTRSWREVADRMKQL